MRFVARALASCLLVAVTAGYARANVPSAREMVLGGLIGAFAFFILPLVGCLLLSSFLARKRTQPAPPAPRTDSEKPRDHT